MQRVSTVALNAIDAERTKWAAALKGCGFTTCMVVQSAHCHMCAECVFVGVKKRRQCGLPGGLLQVVLVLQTSLTVSG
jgi:hypothetical protein